MICVPFQQTPSSHFSPEPYRARVTAVFLFFPLPVYPLFAVSPVLHPSGIGKAVFLGVFLKGNDSVRKIIFPLFRRWTLFVLFDRRCIAAQSGWTARSFPFLSPLWRPLGCRN